MKKIALDLFCIVCLLALFTPAMAQEAEFKNLNETWTLHADGSQEYRYSKELTLYTHTAMNSKYGETFIVYNPDFQELKIHESYTRQKDGTIVKTPENALVACLPAFATKAPAFNHLQEMVVVHTGLELGATIVLDYSILSKAGYKPAEIDICQPLLQLSPIRQYTLTIRSEKPVNYKLAYGKGSINPANQNGALVWSLKHIPAATQEQMTSLFAGDQPYFIASTYTRPGESSQILYKQFAEAHDAQLQALAQTLTEKAGNDSERIQAIHQYMLNNYQLVRIPLGVTGYKLRPTPDVINTAYGTEMELTSLFTGLLRAAGLEADPVAVKLPTDGKPCGMENIQEVFVAVKENGNWKTLQPTKAQASYVQGDLAVRADLADPQKEITLAADPTAIKKHFDLTADSKKANQGYLVVALPDDPKGITHSALNPLNSVRTQNMLLPKTIDEQYDYTISLPESMELASSHFNKSISNAVGSLQQKVEVTNGQLNVSRSLKVNKQLITPAEYKALRELITEWCSQNGSNLLLKNK